MLRVACKRGEGDVSREVTGAWNLPEVRFRDEFVVLNGSDAVGERAVSSVVYVQDGAARVTHHFGHHVDRNETFRTYLNPVSDLRILYLWRELLMGRS